MLILTVKARADAECAYSAQCHKEHEATVAEDNGWMFYFKMAFSLA